MSDETQEKKPKQDRKPREGVIRLESGDSAVDIEEAFEGFSSGKFESLDLRFRPGADTRIVKVSRKPSKGTFRLSGEYVKEVNGNTNGVEVTTVDEVRQYFEDGWEAWEDKIPTERKSKAAIYIAAIFPKEKPQEKTQEIPETKAQEIPEEIPEEVTAE